MTNCDNRLKRFYLLIKKKFNTDSMYDNHYAHSIWKENVEWSTVFLSIIM